MKKSVEVLGGHPHRVIAERVVEPVVGQGVAPVRGVEVVFATSRRERRCSGHAFHTSGQGHTGVAHEHGRLGQPHGFKSRPADLVDRHGGAFDRQSRIDLDLSGDILPQTGRQYVAQDHLVHRTSVDARTLQRLLNQCGCQSNRIERGQTPPEPAGGAAIRGGDDDSLIMQCVIVR